MKRCALALVAVATVAAAAAGDAPAGPSGGDAPPGPYDNPICGTAASPCKPCNRTFRIGAPRLAAPAALGIMGKSLDFLDACFAFYDQPSGVVALDWVEAGFLDMAVVSTDPDCVKASSEDGGAESTAYSTDKPVTTTQTGSIDIDGSATDGVTTEPDTAQFQINTKGGVGAANAKPCKGGETDSVHCKGKAIETPQNGPDLGV